ncbi:hypothetical protein KAU88_00075 [Candidatus Bathyarchaeota archaeon]|nr:hypothetical protein [Candidatus Bathyarchaeota archaeon]
MYAMLRSTKGISTLSLLILLLSSGITGAVLSYLWTVGYYVQQGYKTPEDITTITITNVTFPIENSTYFDVTVLNPSYSKGDANVTSVALVATTNNVETIYNVPAFSIDPLIPYPLVKGGTISFRCSETWGEFAGQTVHVIVFLQDGSGATFPYKTGKVELEIIEAEFDTTVTVERFNITILNSADSKIPLNVTKILFDSVNIPSQNITVKDESATLPQQLQPGQNKTFICNWNLWKKGALGASHTITAQTLQNYSAVYKTATLPPAVSLNITDVASNASYTSEFNVTVYNLPSSPHFINISRITLTNGTQVYENVTITGDAIKGLMPSENVTLQCLWNWEAFKGQEVKITVYTTQGFYIHKLETFPTGEEP